MKMKINRILETKELCGGLDPGGSTTVYQSSVDVDGDIEIGNSVHCDPTLVVVHENGFHNKVEFRNRVVAITLLDTNSSGSKLISFTNDTPEGKYVTDLIKKDFSNYL